VAKEVAPIEGSKRGFSRSCCSRSGMTAYGFGEQLCCVDSNDYIEQLTHSAGRYRRSVTSHIDACALSLESSTTTGLRDNRTCYATNWSIEHQVIAEHGTANGIASSRIVKMWSSIRGPPSPLRARCSSTPIISNKIVVRSLVNNFVATRQY
jgi:hypothetical protein